MFRSLLISAVISANLLGWPQVTKDQDARPDAPKQQANRDKKPIPPMRVIIEEPVPTIHTEPITTNQQSDRQEQPLPRFIRPEWVIVYITAFYVAIAWWTLRAIKRQAASLKEQVDDAKKVNAETAKTASGTLAAIEAQGVVMQAQETLMRDTAHMQLRAYVCIGSAMLRFTGNGDNESFEVHVDIKNSGQTPAYEVRQWIHVWVEAYPLSVPLPEPPQDFPMSNAIIPPGGKTIMIGGPGQSIRAPVVTLGNKSRTIYVYGKVCYKDAFGKSRTTRYRFFYGGNEAPRRERHKDGFIKGILQIDVDGNQAD